MDRLYGQILFESVHDQGLLQAFFIKAHPIQGWVKTQDIIDFFFERIKAVQRPWFSACITPDDSMICDQYNTGGGVGRLVYDYQVYGQKLKHHKQLKA